MSGKDRLCSLFTILHEQSLFILPRTSKLKAKIDTQRVLVWRHGKCTSETPG